ncbi:MAG: PIN domain-containing protein [Candidatus Eremiobacteraeota bacterium]|nr:PIN domain-containing protein [Candidatus Eremiobacteraeota bacterium]
MKSMTERSFIDTNLLVYAQDRSAGAKQRSAADLLDRGVLSGRAVFSTQVFQEYFVTAVRKLGIDPTAARRTIELYSTVQVVLIEVQDILAAVDLHRLHGFSFWDCLIVRAAQVSKCKVLFTEDLQHGQVIDGLRVVNPFL